MLRAPVIHPHTSPQVLNKRPTGTRRYQELIALAYQFGYPIFEQARLTYNFCYAPANPRRVPINSLAHGRVLTGVKEQKITTPNNDTLYSSAALDLSAGPIHLDVPTFACRYYSISFFDAYTNVFACIGSRLNGGGPGRYLLVGPEWKGKAACEEHIIRAPGNYLVALVRIQANGPEDYCEVHGLQDELVLRASAISSMRPFVPPVPDNPMNFVSVVNQVLRESPPPLFDDSVLARLACVGIGPNEGPLTEFQQEIWKRYYPNARTRLLAISDRFGKMVDGWEYPPACIGNFGNDYLARAVIGLKGFWANIPQEQTYTFALADEKGQPLNGMHRHRLYLPTERAEDGAFWSLSMYERTLHGQLFFHDNPIHRYALGSNTAGRSRLADGGVDIVIQRDAPNGEKTGNWLPAPPGPFALVMRVYAPRSANIGRTTFYPPVRRIL